MIAEFFLYPRELGDFKALVCKDIVYAQGG